MVPVSRAVPPAGRNASVRPLLPSCIASSVHAEIAMAVRGRTAGLWTTAARPIGQVPPTLGQWRRVVNARNRELLLTLSVETANTPTSTARIQGRGLGDSVD
jgi:hypothetical protein